MDIPTFVFSASQLKIITATKSNIIVHIPTTIQGTDISKYPN